MEKPTALVNEMHVVLAESYALYVKTHNYHWNVTGPEFGALHAMFQTQYEDLAEALDDIAERIRALDEKVPASFQHFNALKTAKDGDEHLNAASMVEDLYKDNKAISDKMKHVVIVAQEAGDEGTADLLIERIRAHDKNAWMLKSSL